MNDLQFSNTFDKFSSGDQEGSWRDDHLLEAWISVLAHGQFRPILLRWGRNTPPITTQIQHHFKMTTQELTEIANCQIDAETTLKIASETFVDYRDAL